MRRNRAVITDDQIERIDNQQARSECSGHGYKLDTKLLGRGSYAKVTKATATVSAIRHCPKLELFLRKKQRHCPRVAVKVISIHNAPQNYIRKFLPREINALTKSYRHRNVIQLFESFASQERIFLVMELCNGGTLLDKIKQMSQTSMKAMTESTACPIMIGIVQGVNYLHSINITHRDLKPENIMLTRDGIPKLIDFGFARNFSKEVYTMRTLCGSHAYCSPEFLRKRGYFPRQHDVWALGVILYVMLNGTLPYSGRTSADVHASIQKNRPLRQKNPLVTLSLDSMNLIRKTQHVIPRLRVTTRQILDHKWMHIDDALRKNISKHDSRWQSENYEILEANLERLCYVKENITDKTIVPNQTCIGQGERILPNRKQLNKKSIETQKHQINATRNAKMSEIKLNYSPRPRTENNSRRNTTRKTEYTSRTSSRRPKTQPTNDYHNSIYYRL